MKSKGAVLLTILTALVVVLVACKPSGMTQETYDTGLKALEIMEQYNKGALSDDIAKDRIEKLIDHLDGFADNGHESEMVRLIMEGFSIRISAGGDTYESEDELRKQLGKKE